MVHVVVAADLRHFTRRLVGTGSQTVFKLPSQNSTTAWRRRHRKRRSQCLPKILSGAKAFEISRIRSCSDASWRSSGCTSVSPASGACPVATVMLSGGDAGDQTAESPVVRAYRAITQRQVPQIAKQEAAS